MDPTPTIGEIAGSVSPGWQALGRILDNFRLQWNRFFVQYSAADQLAAVRELRAGGASVKDKARGSLTAMMNPIATGLGRVIEYLNRDTAVLLGEFLGLLLLGLSALVWLVRRRLWGAELTSKKSIGVEHAITKLYRRMIQYLARRGVVKPDGTPPLEFIRITQEEWKDAASTVATITELYCRARFGNMRLTSEELRFARANLHQLMTLDRS